MRLQVEYLSRYRGQVPMVAKVPEVLGPLPDLKLELEDKEDRELSTDTERYSHTSLLVE